MSAWAVDVTTMIDETHLDFASLIIDAVDNAKGATTSGVQAYELIAQRSTEPSGVVEQGAGDEVDDGDRNPLGQVLGDHPCGGRGNDELVASTAHR